MTEFLITSSDRFRGEDKYWPPPRPLFDIPLFRDTAFHEYHTNTSHYSFKSVSMHSPIPVFLPKMNHFLSGFSISLPPSPLLYSRALSPMWLLTSRSCSKLFTPANLPTQKLHHVWNDQGRCHAYPNHSSTSLLPLSSQPLFFLHTQPFHMTNDQ